MEDHKMADRVLSTGQAKQSITKMKSLIDGGLAEQITALNQEGTTLSDPNVWDGNLAAQFRSDWPQIHSTLNKVKEQLAQLQAQINTINTNIMTAGGNS
jgi:uncharacterized protein YukE